MEGNDGRVEKRGGSCVVFCHMLRKSTASAAAARSDIRIVSVILSYADSERSQERIEKIKIPIDLVGNNVYIKTNKTSR